MLLVSDFRYESSLFFALILLSFALIHTSVNKETMYERTFHK